MKYRIPVSWEMYGHVEVEADSLEEAISIAESDETPLPDGDYINGSFEVDYEIAENDYPDEDE